MYLRLSKAFILLTLAASSNTIAVELTENIHSSGFLSVGAANYRSFDHDEGSWQRDWHQIAEAGITISATMPYDLEFNGQALYRDFSNLSKDSKFKIDYASIDWRNASLGVGEQTVSLGRVKSGGGIYNHTRDIPFIRPSVLLPNSVYMEDFRSVYSHIDGVRLASDFYIGGGDLRVEFTVGNPDLGDDFIINLYSNSVTAKWQADGATYFDIRYQNANWLLTYSRVQVDAKLDGSLSLTAFDGSSIAYPDNNTLDFISNSVGLQYQHQKFEVTLEYAKQNIQAENSTLSFSLERDIDGYYGQFRYFLYHDVSILLRKEKLNFDINWDIRPNAPFGLLNSEQYAFGVNWRINTDWQLNVEGHRNKTDFGDQDLALMQLSWRF